MRMLDVYRPIDLERELFSILGDIRQYDNTVVNVTEDGSKTYTIDVPGVSDDDLNIEVKDGIASVEAKRSIGGSGSYSRRFRIPDSHDADTLEARLQSGVLTLSVKPRPDKIPKKIPLIK